MFESGSFLSRGGRPTGGLARGLWPHAVLDRQQRLLHGARRSSRGSLPRTAAPHRSRIGSQTPGEWLWHARRVRVVDGSTITMSEALVLREVRVRVKQRGFRTKTVVVVTTLLDVEEFSADEIGELYRRRWQAELHLRSLKVTLQMDHLRCQTPHRVRNELFMHLLAYNLIRRVMALAALEAEVSPW